MPRSIPLSKLPGILRRDRARIIRAGKQGTKAAIQAGVEVVRGNAPKAFGDLRNSIHATATKIVVDAPHAAAVEVGSRPHEVPLEDLVMWVKLRGMQGLTKARTGAHTDPKKIGPTTRAHAIAIAKELKSMEQGGALSVDAPEQIAKAIQKAIREHGTAPTWFAMNSLPELEQDLKRHVTAYIDLVFAEINNRYR